MRLAALAFAALVLAPAAVDAKPKKAAKAAAVPTAAPGTPTIKLISAGAGTRRALRWRFAKGATFSPRMEMKMAMTMAMGAAPGTKVDLPAMRIGMTGKVVSVDAFGGATVTSTITDLQVVEAPGANAAIVSALRTQLQAMKGIELGFSMDPRGRVTNATTKVPPTVPAQVAQMMGSMQQSLGQIVAPFPEEAVGPGASWDVATHASVNGITLDQTARYQLASIDGDRGTAKISLTQTAAPQEIKAPGMPAGVVTKLRKLASTGAGTLTFDLGQLVPVAATMTVTSDTSMTVSMGGNDQAIDMKMEMSMTLPVP